MKNELTAKVSFSVLVTFIVLFLVQFSLLPTPALSEEKPVELRFTTSATTLHPIYKACQKYVEEVTRRTGGKVHITVYPIGTLCPPLETYKAVKTGIAQIGLAPIGFSGQFMPLNKLFGDALRGLSTSTEAVMAYQTAFKAVPELREEFEGVHLLYFWSTWPMGIGTTKKPITRLEDFKGTVMRFPPGLEPLARAWGASPISLSVNDIYAALQKGTVQGYFASPEVLKAWRLAEQTKYVTFPKITYGLGYTVINEKAWESLPPDVRKTMDSLSGWAQNVTLEYMDEAQKQNLEFAKSQEVEFVEIEKEQLDRLYAASDSAFEEKAADLETRGISGNKVLAEARRLSKK